MSSSSSRKCEACPLFHPCSEFKSPASFPSPKKESMQNQNPEKNPPAAPTTLETSKSKQSSSKASKKDKKNISNSTEASSTAPKTDKPAAESTPSDPSDPSATSETATSSPPPKSSQTKSPATQQETEKSKKETEKNKKGTEQSITAKSSKASRETHAQAPTAPPHEGIAVTRADGEHPAVLADEKQSALQAHEKQPAAQARKEQSTTQSQEKDSAAQKREQQTTTQPPQGQTATKPDQDRLQSANEKRPAIPRRNSHKSPSRTRSISSSAKKMSSYFQDLPFILIDIANIIGVYLFWVFGLIRTYMNAYPTLKIVIYLGLALSALPIGIFIAFLVGSFVMLSGAATIVVLALSGSAALGGLIFLGPIVLGIAGLASVVAALTAMTDWVRRLGWLMSLIRRRDDSRSKGKETDQRQENF